MTVDSMTSRVFNYLDSDVDLTCPYFKASTDVIVHNSDGVYGNISIEPGGSYTTNVDWLWYLSAYEDLYATDRNRYTIPTNLNDSSNVFVTEIGIYAGPATNDAPISYQYVAYWYGDGTIRVLDMLSDDSPIWRTKSVSPLQPSNTSLSLVNIAAEESTVEEMAYAAIRDGSMIALEVDYDDEIQFGSLPIVATDENFENCIDVNFEQVSFLADNIMGVDLESENYDGDLFVKMPTVTVVDESQSALLTNINGSEMSFDYDENINSKVLVVEYEADEVPIIPNSAVLIGENSINCIVTQAFFDVEGQPTGGRMFFAVPDDYSLSNINGIMLKDALVQVEGSVIQVQ